MPKALLEPRFIDILHLQRPDEDSKLAVLLLEILPGRLELSVKPRVPDSKAHGHTVYTSFWSLLLICRLGTPWFDRWARGCTVLQAGPSL